MSSTLVTTLVELGRHRADYPDISRRSGGNGTMMVVQSNRQAIAKLSALANETGASYTPPPELRRDEVTVTCGDIAARHFVHCDQIVITTPANRAVPPLKASGGPETFHNEFGATWVVRRATAVFPAAALKDGFVVTGWSKDSQSWTLVVTAQDAVDFLLLGPTPGQLPPN